MGRPRNFGKATGIQMWSQSKRRFSLRYQKLISQYKTHVPTQINYYCSKQGQGLRLVFTKTVQSPRATYRVESMGTPTQVKFVKTSNLTHAGKRDGYRLIDLNLLGSHMVDVVSHCVKCLPCNGLVDAGGLPISFLGEVSRQGMASQIQVQCRGCQKIIVLNTSEQISVGNTKAHDVNVRAAWG